MKYELQAANAGVVDVATSEVIAKPIKLNLQLFAEGDLIPTEDPAPSIDPIPSSDPVPDPTPTPDVTQTQVFSQRLKESTTKAKDEIIAELYGESHGIKTYSDYQKAVNEAKEAEDKEKFQNENGFNPDSVKPLFEQWKQSDPDFQELSKIRQEKNINQSLTDLNNELKDNGVDIQLKDLSDSEIAKIPNVDKVTEYVSKGHSLADAFFLANKKDIISRQTAAVQQETIKKIAANGASSPGSLAGGSTEETFFTKEQVEKMSKEDVKKNLKIIQKSTPKW